MIPNKLPTNRLVSIGMPIIMLYASLVGGCAHQAYVGEARSSEETATIEDTYWGSFRFDRAMIIGVDHDDFGDFGRERVSLLPGMHKIYIMCYHGWNIATTGLYGRHEVVEFEAKAKHKYKTYCLITGGSQWSWIVELESDSIVGGKKP
jgi:hypothetical protein